MAEPDTQPGGLLETLRRIGESSVALARGRVELFAVEWQEEKLRLLSLLGWFAAALTLMAAGTLVGVGTLALWLWNAAGYLGLLALTAALLSGGGLLAWSSRRRMQQAPAPFTATMTEFAKDGVCLRNNNSPVSTNAKGC